jgi:hypothetical protein
VARQVLEHESLGRIEQAVPKVIDGALRLDRGRPWLSSALRLVRDRFFARGAWESGGLVDYHEPTGQYLNVKKRDNTFCEKAD